MPTPRLIAFAGSLRQGSYNHKLVEIAAAGARAAGAEVEVVRLGDMPMPLFDQDLEQAHGMPAPARRFKRLLVESQGYLIASPEYNSSISGALKNAIDWASRTESADEPALAAFRGKVCGLMSASPGALGGIRGLPTVRMILSNLNVLVIPDQFALSRADQAFDEHSALIDDKVARTVRAIGARVTEIAQRLHS